ncbi:hypothetical protein M7I_6661 [Glarea lozoyensis 74030]|uniref:Uncharacterized protein n=1 Tax=Glarea lozoyensis (strain ATCC 74030 / MF5533) TaxID=1104152 RepID=H0EV67_GLAL7|nr:hypothetical protein M7I_6661 [Glarea lozoyensis 74030]
MGCGGGIFGHGEDENVCFNLGFPPHPSTHAQKRPCNK